MSADNSVPETAHRVALVTGTSGGIGSACVSALQRFGFKLALHCRTRTNTVESLLNSGQGNTENKCFEADLAVPGNAQRLVERVTEDCGPPLVLVHAAGALLEKPVAFSSVKEWDAALELHALSGFSLAKAMMRGFSKHKWGRMVFVGSLAGASGLGNAAAYAATKGALAGLARSLAQECGRWNVTANVVAPGYVESAMTGHHNDARKERLQAAIPLGRYGQPEEVAGLVAYLCSEEGGYLNGQVVVVDGGLSLGH